MERGAAVQENLSVRSRQTKAALGQGAKVLFASRQSAREQAPFLATRSAPQKELEEGPSGVRSHSQGFRKELYLRAMPMRLGEV